MKFYSTKNTDLSVNFKEALLSGIAPDGGLYMPKEIPKFTTSELRKLSGLNFNAVAFEVARKFISEEEISNMKLKEICNEAYNFPVPLFELDEGEFILELFEGPTMSFKDFAARFMARCASYFLEKSGEKRNILVATSGDTGSAIGNSFMGLKNVNVFILYPKGGVSPIQEKQLTTMDGNIFAVEIDGDFDDCQRMVKEIFADTSFNSENQIMSANSINVGRVIPQSFYYMWSACKLSRDFDGAKLVYSVPSGNMGNITGGIFAKMMGAPIEQFILSNNSNHPFVDYLQSGKFKPTPAVHTISNAMDIGHPNNFYRLESLFKSPQGMKKFIIGSFFTDKETEKEIDLVHRYNHYIMCPHTAVAHLGIKKFKNNYKNPLFVTVSTAHPAKFIESVEPILERKLDIPEKLKEVMGKEKKAELMKPETEILKKYLEAIIKK